MAFDVTPKCTAQKPILSDDDDDDRGQSERWLKRKALSGRKLTSSKSKVIQSQSPNRYAQNALQESELTLKAHQAPQERGKKKSKLTLTRKT